MAICARLPRIPVLKKSICVPLHTGILILGYFNLLLGSVVLPKMFYRLIKKLSPDWEEPPRLPLEFPEDAERVDAGEDLDAMDLQQHAVTVAWMSIDMVLSVLLLCGTHAKKIILMKVYLVMGITLQVATLASDIAFYEFDNHYDNFVYFFFNGLNVYLLYMVYSYTYPHADNPSVSGEVRYKPQTDELPTTYNES